MTAAVRPRALVHRGVHAAAGLLLDAGGGRDAAARARALALWSPGVRVHAVDGGFLVRFPRPVPLDAAAAPGHLVLEDGGLLLAAPLAPAERAALAAPAGAVVAVRGGRAVALVPGAEVDPAAWLALAPALVAVEPLGAPPPPPAPPPEVAQPELRTALGIPPPAPERAAVLAALRAATERGPAPPPGPRALAALAVVAGAVAVAAAGLAGVIPVFFARIGAAVRDELHLASGGRVASRGRALPARPAAPAGPGPVQRALVRLAFLTRFARLAGLRQGAYLGRMLRMFERGDLDQALRHAVPLGRDGATGLLSFGTPRPRGALAIAPEVARGGAMLHSGPDLHAELQRLYRNAFLALERQGRIDEAAFVLAELLRADEEAVSFLERHGRLRLAAELAESRGLPPGLVVRQWFLAGDMDRAVALARAGRAFVDAVERLERSGRRKEADALRLVWAEDLAEAGDLEGAVAAARKVEPARALVLGWTVRAVEAGGPAGEALLATWLELAPERFAEVRARVLDACADASDDGPLRRAAVARGLLGGPATAAARALARPVLRGALKDAAAGQGPAPQVGRLVTLAADGALEVDLPALAAPAAAPATAALRLGADDRGTRPVLDAAVLPGGRVLAALGEAGAALLARDGRAVARFDVPAYRLVVSDAGTRALALAPRGDALRVAALDLAARTARPLRDVRLDACATSFDGAAWVVAVRNELLVLDTLREDLRTLWHVADLPGAPGALQRDGRSIRFATAAGDAAAELWRYELPGPVLRDRDRRELGRGTNESDEALHGLRAVGDRWIAVVQAADGATRIRPAWGLGAAHAVAGARELLALAGGDALAAAFSTEAGAVVVALGRAALEPRATIALDGAREVRVRVEEGRLTACDDLGRVVGVALEERRVTHLVRC